MLTWPEWTAVKANTCIVNYSAKNNHNFDWYNNQSLSTAWTEYICLVENTQETFLSNFCLNISYDREKKNYFHFFHYVYENIKLPLSRMRTSNGNRNMIFVVAIVMNIIWQFKLHPPYIFWEDF